MTLDESYDENNDLIMGVDNLRIVYEKKLESHLEGKVVDYQTAPNEGFAIYSSDGAGGCDSSGDCEPSGGCGDGCCH